MYDIHTVNVMKLSDKATTPTKAHTQDAGWDLYSSEDVVRIPPKTRYTVKTDIALEMPTYFAGLIWPRSGLSVKNGVDVLAGVVDSGYRGEIMVCLYNTGDKDVLIKHGDRIAQIIFQEVPAISLLLREELETSQRGSNGFGSTGT